MSKRVRTIQHCLRVAGFPLQVDGKKGAKTDRAIKDFKRGWAFKHRFVLRNGDATSATVGPLTMRCLKKSRRLGGACSPHFSYKEFKSKGNGWVRVHRDLVHGLEEYRRVAGTTSVVSGYRDAAHNQAVGGAELSQHTDLDRQGQLGGKAADLNPKLGADRVKAMRRFSGIGIVRASGLVRHVDVRHAGPVNTTGGSVDNPTIWFYG